MDYIAAHRKALLAAIAAVLTLFTDSATADTIVAAVATLLILVVPNDQPSIDRIYRQGGRGAG